MEAVPVEWRPCRLGGIRPFFRCPGLIRSVACHRRVVKLYLADDVFLCRHCCGLPCSCQFEGPADRGRRRADKLRSRLGGEPGAFAPWPERPRGMRWHRYERMCSEIAIAERRADAAMTERFAPDIPRLRTGTCFPNVLVWRHTAETALVACP